MLIIVIMMLMKVIINLQQTPRDGEATLRMFSNTDPTFEVTTIIIIPIIIIIFIIIVNIKTFITIFRRFLQPLG